MSTLRSKRRVAMPPDDALVAEIESEVAGLSHHVNDALRAEKRRCRALGNFLNYLAEQNGPVNAPEDEGEVHRLMERIIGPVEGVPTGRRGVRIALDAEAFNAVIKPGHRARQVRQY